MIIFGSGIIIAGYDVFTEAVENLFKAHFLDENFLMVVAAIGTFLIGQYPEGLAVLLFFQIGELFEDHAVGDTEKAITDLVNIQAEYANLQRDGHITKVDPKNIQIGDIIVIKPGERIPLDGRIIEGISNIDTKALTGEPVPKYVEPGSEIMSGCINLNGVLKAEVTNTYDNSTVTKLLELIKESASKKSNSEKFITKFAKYYTPAVVLAAIFIAIVPSILYPSQTSTWTYRALMFLVVSCPCALVASIPLGFFCGIGCSSKNGILVKGSNYLEALAATKTVVFDKTGTLTKGEFKVSRINSVKLEEEELIEYAAKAEYYSDHPISASLKECHGKEIDPAHIAESVNIPGKGVRSVILGKTIHVGNSILMKEIGIVSSHSDSNEGTNVHVAVEKDYAGHIVVSDTIKEDSAYAIKELRKSGVTTIIMLTGDSDNVGQTVSQKLGLDMAYTELLPQDKIKKLEDIINLQTVNKKTIFVGDGINDAPSLARADIGIAMGGLGSDAAIEAADIIIMDDNPLKVATGILIARKTVSIVRENIVFSLSVKFGVLFLITFGLLGMWTAIFADVGVLVVAVLNSTRALNVKRLPISSKTESAKTTVKIS